MKDKRLEQNKIQIESLKRRVDFLKKENKKKDIIIDAKNQEIEIKNQDIKSLRDKLTNRLLYPEDEVQKELREEKTKNIKLKERIKKLKKMLAIKKGNIISEENEEEIEDEESDEKEVQEENSKDKNDKIKGINNPKNDETIEKILEGFKQEDTNKRKKEIIEKDGESEKDIKDGKGVEDKKGGEGQEDKIEDNKDGEIEEDTKEDKKEESKKKKKTSSKEEEDDDDDDDDDDEFDNSNKNNEGDC